MVVSGALWSGRNNHSIVTAAPSTSTSTATVGVSALNSQSVANTASVTTVVLQGPTVASSAVTTAATTASTNGTTDGTNPETSIFIEAMEAILNSQM